MAIKAKHRRNLTKLADYLDALPEGYERFDMWSYMLDGSNGHEVGRPGVLPSACGSVACAIGHGPSAGIRRRGDRNWEDYCSRVFGTGDAWSYLFSAQWAYFDNTPKGAAARIRTYLELGHAPAGWEQAWAAEETNDGR